MTISYYPFDAGAGSSVTEAQWMKMMRHILSTGVAFTTRTHIDMNLFEVYADSTGMQVKVKSGTAWIEGFLIESDAEEIITISTADPSNPRIDRIILKLDRTANTITITKKNGTPAGSPAAPALTQDANTWELTLAQVLVDAGASTIAAGKVTDERTYTTTIRLYRPATQNARELHQTLTDGATINWNLNDGGSAQITLGGNRTMAAPTNLRLGATYVLQVLQDGTGSRTLTWNAIFKWPSGTAPVLSTGASKKDLLSFYCPDGVNLWGNILKDML